MSAAAATVTGVVTLHAAYRPEDDISAEAEHLTIEADTYDAAFKQAQEAAREGLQLLYVRREG